MIAEAAILVLVFFLARYLITRFTARAERANLLAFGIVVVVLVGTVAINQLQRVSPQDAVIQSTPTQNTPPAQSTPSPSSIANVTSDCRLPAAIRTSGTGYVDAIVFGASDAHALARTGTMPEERAYAIVGWGTSGDTKHLARAVCLLADGRVVPAATSLYGISRPDVATATHVPAFAAAGFRIELPARSLKSGRHRLAVAILSEDGSAAYAHNTWNVTVP